ncbi:MAG: GNAT family N-acetyltransferase [Armatimonadetes bacterium]|nr:GNAT family N-acetyltransferase [Armatimonadota bacterium]
MEIRRIDEQDVEGTIAVYHAVYGDGFPFQEFYDARWVKKGVFDDDIAWFVAEDDGQIVGSAAVMLNVGDADDLIGEFGRLVVDPEARSGGIGTRLIEACLAHAQGRVEVGFAECRVAHPGAQKICSRSGFAPVGFEPLAYKLAGNRESVAFMATVGPNALQLRKNNPHTIASVYPLGSAALRAVGCEPDLIAESSPESYPIDDTVAVGAPKGEYDYRLLRIGKGRVVDREVFGGVRLEYGFLKLAAHQAQYLVAEREGQPVGAAGFVHDPIDEKVRLTELIAVSDAVKGSLLKAFVEHVTQAHGPAYVQVDVRADSPRMQQSLWELGFVPVAYFPAMVFEQVERLDVVKMVRLTVPWDLGPIEMIDSVVPFKELVEAAFVERHRGAVIADVTRRVRIFQGLGDWDVERLRAICSETRLRRDQRVFVEGDPGQELYVVVEGEVQIVADRESRQVLASIGPGEVFGELALVDGLPRSAGATCAQDSTLLVLQASDFRQLTARHPAIGRTVLLNLCRTLSSRLRAADQALESLERRETSP